MGKKEMNDVKHDVVFLDECEKEMDYMRDIDGTNTDFSVAREYAQKVGFSAQEAQEIAESTRDLTDKYNKQTEDAIMDPDGFAREMILGELSNLSAAEACTALDNKIHLALDLGVRFRKDGADKENYLGLVEAYKNRLDILGKIAPLSDEKAMEMRLELYLDVLDYTQMMNFYLQTYSDVMDTKVVAEDGDFSSQASQDVYMQLWAGEERRRYFRIVAAVIAKRKGQLRSIPQDMPDEVLVCGMVCGNIFQEAIEKMRKNEHTMDICYNILKGVGIVLYSAIAMASVTALMELSITGIINGVEGVLGTTVLASIMEIVGASVVVTPILCIGCAGGIALGGLLYNKAEQGYEALKEKIRAMYLKSENNGTAGLQKAYDKLCESLDDAGVEADAVLGF